MWDLNLIRFEGTSLKRLQVYKSGAEFGKSWYNKGNWSLNFVISLLIYLCIHYFNANKDNLLMWFIFIQGKYQQSSIINWGKSYLIKNNFYTISTKCQGHYAFFPHLIFFATFWFVVSPPTMWLHKSLSQLECQSHLWKAEKF